VPAQTKPSVIINCVTSPRLASPSLTTTSQFYSSVMHCSCPLVSPTSLSSLSHTSLEDLLLRASEMSTLDATYRRAGQALHRPRTSTASSSHSSSPTVFSSSSSLLRPRRPSSQSRLNTTIEEALQLLEQDDLVTSDWNGPLRRSGCSRSRDAMQG